ncbi:hypothetical protein [Streptomyces wedmorensis]
MTFEYRDADCDKLVAQADTDDNRKPVVFISTTGLNSGVYIPLDRVEEVVAGIRDAARTAVRQTTGQTDSHPGYDIAGYPETHAGPREKCPDPACETDQHTTCGAECPAVGQPAEAQPADPPLTAAERQFLTFALKLAADRMSIDRRESKRLGFEDPYSDEDDAALDSLLRMAEEARS